jgi:hypothetical protein
MRSGAPVMGYPAASKYFQTIVVRTTATTVTASGGLMPFGSVSY